jgi:hypothetical protein
VLHGIQTFAAMEVVEILWLTFITDEYGEPAAYIFNMRRNVFGFGAAWIAISKSIIITSNYNRQTEAFPQIPSNSQQVPGVESYGNSFTGCLMHRCAGCKAFHDIDLATKFTDQVIAGTGLATFQKPLVTGTVDALDRRNPSVNGYRYNKLIAVLAYPVWFDAFFN